MGESIDAYALRLSGLAKACRFEAVTAKEYQDEAVLGTFISGIEDKFIRQRLLENETLTLAEAVKQAEILERAHEKAKYFEMHEGPKQSIVAIEAKVENKHQYTDEHCAITKQENFKAKPRRACWNCGFMHIPLKCPAKDQRCYNCNRTGYFSKCCKKERKESVNSLLANIDYSLADSVIEVQINNQRISALLDTGASENFMDCKLSKKLGLKIEKEVSGSVALANKKQRSKIEEKN